MAPNEISQQLASITRRLDEQDKKYDARREEDDARETRARSERQLLLDRVDAHGRRTTVLETDWKAFFSDQGAFRLFCKQINDQAAKTDRLTWLVAVGLGIVITLQFMLKR